jgi:hypothetical protein
VRVPYVRTIKILPCLAAIDPSYHQVVVHAAATMSSDAAEQNIQMWKVKKLIKSLDSARG